jgi:O-acetyl-ADP-ribose deacetylase (regulator of RNase III)
MIEAWQKFFWDTGVTILQQDITDLNISAIVAPGNSSGFMSAGLDLAIARRFPGIEDKIQKYAPIEFGSLVRVPTGDRRIPEVVYAPTMERAMDVSNTFNAFMAMRTILHETEGPIAIPGLCAGIGKMLPAEAALQMYQAYVGYQYMCPEKCYGE